MPTAILRNVVVMPRGKVKDRSQTVTITHSNKRLYHHTDGHTYEYVGNDASGNRIYRNTRKVRG